MNMPQLPLVTLTLLSLLVSLDFVSVVLLFQTSVVTGAVYIGLTLHSLNSILGTFVLGRELRLQPKHQSQQRNFYALLFQFILFLPVIGLVAAFIFAYHHLFVNKEEKESLDIDALLLQPDAGNLDLPLVPEKKFQELLRHQDPDSYLQLILSTRYMDEHNAVRILKFALNTDIENVRLLAQARLDNKENNINQALDRYIALSQTDEHRKNIHLYLEIAQYYWNLADLGLAKDAVLEHVLKQLYKYTRIVQLLQPHEPKSYYLAGKGLLLSKKLQAAKQQFRLALKTGMPKHKILSPLREIAFYEYSQATVMPASEQRTSEKTD